MSLGGDNAVDNGLGSSLTAMGSRETDGITGNVGISTSSGGQCSRLPVVPDLFSPDSTNYRELFHQDLLEFYHNSVRFIVTAVAPVEVWDSATTSPLFASPPPLLTRARVSPVVRLVPRHCLSMVMECSEEATCSTIHGTTALREELFADPVLHVYRA
ncbi:uncharacterized protein LOC144122861 [Amblyomma americanum]